MLPDPCKECGLHKTCKTHMVPGSGSDHPLVLFVGEAPGAEEDETGVVFMGKAGQVLREAINQLGLSDDQYRITNVVRCRPPKNRTPRAREIELCSEFLFEEIKQHPPKVIVLLGNTPLKAVLGENKISEWNGLAVQRGDFVYAPAFHPSAFNYGNRDRLEDWYDALEQAVRIAHGEKVPDRNAGWEYIYPKSYDDLVAMERELAKSETITYDVETRFLNIHDPENTVISVSFGMDGVAWSFPLYHTEGSEWWKGTRILSVVGMVLNILSKSQVVGHNVKFDRSATRKLLGQDFVPFGDTMRISQLIDSQPGIHGLKRLAGMKLGMFDYDQELTDYTDAHPEANPKKGGDFGLVPLKKLLPYGAMDSAATYRLYHLLLSELTPEQTVLYKQLIMPADDALAEMEYRGILLDTYMAERYERIYKFVREEKYRAAILQDPDVQRFIARKQKIVDIELKKRREKSTRKLKDRKFSFNANSTEMMGEVFFTIKDHVPPALTKTGKPSMDAGLLAQSPVADDPLFQLYRKYRLYGSMLSKYLGPASKGLRDWRTCVDGRIHTHFNVGGATTGRLSSSQPNLQNIPSPEKEQGTLLESLPIRNLFKHTHPGGCLASVDFSGMELRIMASMSECLPMIKVFRENGDLHRFVTSAAFSIPEKDVTKTKRRTGKSINFLIIYGGGPESLHRKYGVPLSQSKRLMKNYFKRFPEVHEFHNKVIDFAERNGYVETPFGRRRYLRNINSVISYKKEADERAAINMPIQSLASDILLCCIAILERKLIKGGFKSRMVNTVHDSITFDVYPGELDTILVMARDIMVNIKYYAKRYFPGLDFSWLKVPLNVDAEVGSHYGSMSDYEIPGVVRGRGK